MAVRTIGGKSHPQRIQRKRTKGWRMPEGAVYVGRPTRWGNPFVVHTAEILMRPETGEDWWYPNGDARQGAVDMFRDLAGPRPLWLPAAISELRSRDLACWCPLDQPCHADVLLELANREASR